MPQELLTSDMDSKRSRHHRRSISLWLGYQIGVTNLAIMQSLS